MISFAAWTSTVVVGGTLFLLGTSDRVDRVTIDGIAVNVSTLGTDTRWLPDSNVSTNLAVRVPSTLAVGSHTLDIVRGAERWSSTVTVLDRSKFPGESVPACLSLDGPPWLVFDSSAGWWGRFAVLTWNHDGPLIVPSTSFPATVFPLVGQAVRADGTAGAPWRFGGCHRHPTRLNRAARRFQLWNLDGSARFP